MLIFVHLAHTHVKNWYVHSHFYLKQFRWILIVLGFWRITLRFYNRVSTVKKKKVLCEYISFNNNSTLIVNTHKIALTFLIKNVNVLELYK